MSESKYIFSISIMKRHMRILIRWLQIVENFQTVIPDYHMYSNPVNTKIHRPSCSAKYLILNCHGKIRFKFLLSNFIYMYASPQNLGNSKTNTVKTFSAVPSLI